MTDASAPNRRERRLPFRTRVKVRADSWDRVVSLYTQNISRGGMFLRTESPPAVGAELTLQIVLPDGRTLDLAAAVAHVVSPERAKLDKRTPGMGIFFQPLSDAQREAIEDILDQAHGSGPVVDPAKATPPPPTTSRADDAIPQPIDGDNEVSDAYDQLAALDDESAKLLAALEAELGRLRECRPWEVLGVPPDAAEDQIASAYRVLCKRYHPDVFAQWRAGEVRSAASDCFIVVKKAHERLQALRRAQPQSRPRPAAAEPRPIAQPTPVAVAQPPPVVAAAPAPSRARMPQATPQPVRRPVAPVVVAPPAAPAPKPGARPAHSFAVPQGLAPGAPPKPQTIFPQVAEPMPVEEFKPSPTQLTAKDLFDDISQQVPVVGAQPTGGGSVRHAPAPNRPAAEEGIELFRAKRYTDARTKLAEALRRDPRNRILRITYHLSVGHDLKAQCREDDARKQFESVLVLDPENAEAIAALRSQSVEKQAAKRTFLDKLLSKK